ncbi:DASH complex subunit Dam1-domain-containing protein [Lineolata rhizophorae]|uniref:DASH complex subunit DAM1 n=1 Tax=Lineolata rhizophorae TaxID=578093 RepID=A0A6A6P6P8_9PEZI|nr:DASH complex subunit Dam1-domain-containing protein [Lineolata rhizophorae]
MATSTTPQSAHRRSVSRTGRPPSRPTTPLRPASRTSLRSSSQHAQHRTGRSPSAPRQRRGSDPSSSTSASATGATPLETTLEPPLAELADSMADLEANMMHLQLLHESLARFGESFAAFLYGLNMNAFCVDFPEAPAGESFGRARALEAALEGQRRREEQLRGQTGALGRSVGDDGEATFLTTDTSFVENPPSSRKPASKFSTPAPASRVGRSGAGGASARGGAAGRGAGRTRGSGLARATGRARGAKFG